MAPRETLPWIILCIRMVWLFARILLSHTRCTKVQKENGNDIAAIVRIFWRNFFFCILFLCSVFVLSSRCFISLFFHSFTVCVCVCVPFFFCIPFCFNFTSSFRLPLSLLFGDWEAMFAWIINDELTIQQFKEKWRRLDVSVPAAAAAVVHRQPWAFVWII